MNYKIDFENKRVDIDEKIEVLTIGEILNEIANYERKQEKSYKWKFKTKDVSVNTVK